MKPVLYGVSVGPGDPELLTVKAVRTIESCDVVAAPLSRKGSTHALDIAGKAVDLAEKRILSLELPMSKDTRVLEEYYAAAADLITSELAAGNSVALLTLGDVSIYSSFCRLKPLVEKAGYEAVAIPGVPSFCAVAAILEQNLTPNMTTPLHIVPAGFDNLEEVLSYPGTKVIMKAGKPLEQVKQTLRNAGLYENASLVQNCGLEDEQVVHSLDDIEQEAKYLTTMVVRPDEI